MIPACVAQTSWVNQYPTVTPAVAYDEHRGETVMFDGCKKETWIWTGTKWVQKRPVHTPPAIGGFAVTYDAARQQVVLFGGVLCGEGINSNETWVWDGADWTQKFPVTNPSGRTRHSLAYDAARREVVLFGGDDSVGLLADTWTWDGTAWVEKHPMNSPPPLRGPGMAFDAGRLELLLVGVKPGIFGGTWVWDGDNWSEKVLTNNPNLGPFLAIAYDAVRARVVMRSRDVTWI
jgi:hypothetical protein